MSDPILVRRRLEPTASRARLLLEAVSEVESIEEGQLPPAHLAAHALAAIRQDAPRFKPERILIQVKGIGHDHLATRVAGIVAPVDFAHARACARVVQRSGRVLDIEAHGRLVEPARARPHPVPGKLAAFARAVDLRPRDYARLEAWPADYVAALCAAGVEAENENEGGLAKLIRLNVELVNDGPISSSLRLAIDGVRPLSGDMAKVVFRVTSGAGRLVARGDALIVSALARSSAMAIPLRLVA
jgi:hypothetical protein